MAYLGNVPARSFISFERQVFTIVNSQTAYTLSHSVTNENDIRLVVNNVVQEPGSGKAYTASGTTLTLSAALTNGTDEMYCVFLGRAVGTVNAPAGSVDTAQLADDAVTLAKMASGTDGNIISYDASGNPVAVATGSAGQILTSAGAGAPPTFAGAGTNTPAFSVRLNSAQNIANSTFVKIAFDGELFDTDSAFASNKFTVPSGEGGNYFFNYGIQYLAYNANRGISSFRKNGTEIQTSEISPLTTSTNPTITGALSLNLSAGDYLEVFVYQNSGSAQDIRGSNTELFTYFGGYKIIT